MDLWRNGSPVTRQWNVGSSNTVSPAHRLGNGVSAIKRTQKVASKTAAKRFAQVMATRRVDDDDVENDDLRLRYSASTTLPPPPGAKSLGNGVSVNITRGFASTKANRSPSHGLGQNIVEHRPSVRSASVGRCSTSVLTANMVPSNKSSLRSPVSVIPIEHPTSSSRERRFTLELGQTKRDTGYEHEVSALRAELDMLQEENEDILNRLHRAEKRCEEAEARARELEKQVASLGEGVSLEAKLMSRKEAALRQREAALKAKKQSYEQKDEEISALRLELENLKDETAKAMDQLQEAESEAKALHTMTERMILTEEEMEEVVLKRCWLARYWGLAAQYGICAVIAASKHEHWSALAPLPVELVISAGQKAKDGSWVKDTKKSDRKLSDLNGEGNIEAMLSVEIGLRELASLKVEHAVMLELAQYRRPSMVRKSTSTEVSDSRSSSDQKFIESDELINEEAEDVLFKQAWLAYFWRRAVVHGIEDDIAEERLHFWISRSYGPSLTSQDALDVERGLMELRKLSIEQQLWEASRREIDQPLPTLSPDDKSDTEPEIS